jgi:hypothetical protein
MYGSKPLQQQQTEPANYELRGNVRRAAAFDADRPTERERRQNCDAQERSQNLQQPTPLCCWVDDKRIKSGETDQFRIWVDIWRKPWYAFTPEHHPVRFTENDWISCFNYLLSPVEENIISICSVNIPADKSFRQTPRSLQNLGIFANGGKVAGCCWCPLTKEGHLPKHAAPVAAVNLLQNSALTT